MDFLATRLNPNDEDCYCSEWQYKLDGNPKFVVIEEKSGDITFVYFVNPTDKQKGIFKSLGFIVKKNECFKAREKTECEKGNLNYI